MAMVERTMTTAVVTFTPPAVEPGLPPINIRTIVKNLLESFSAAVSTLLKPAVLGVTELNREPNILSLTFIPASTLSFSIR